MSLNRFPGFKKNTKGRDYNFFEKIDVNWAEFGENSVDGEQPDMVITFPTQSIMLLNEADAGIVEYSFNGNTIHGELDAEKASKGLVFDNRVASPIWFRLKSGSTGPITIRVDAWGTR